MIDAQWSPHMHVIPITCIVRAIQPQIISTLMMMMMLMVGMLMMMVGGVLMEVRLRSLIYCVCCLPPSHPKPFDNHIISNRDDETLIRTFIPSVQCNTL